MRVKVSYTFEESVKDEFNSICEEKCINRSALLEKYIKKFIKESKEDK
jgi:metal-responsive CopG/Arc/MetJ family transcriptional regulator